MSVADQKMALASPFALPYVVALTGHRDLHPADIEVVAEQLYQAIRLISAALPHTPIHFLSALADGADQLFAEQVLRLQRESVSQKLHGYNRIELIVPLPMPFEQYCIEQAGGAQFQQRDPQGFELARKAFTSRFLRCSAHAAKVFVIPQVMPATLLSAPQSPAQAAYAQLTHYFGVHAQLLIAVWDGQPETELIPRRPGGTLDLVQNLIGRG